MTLFINLHYSQKITSLRFLVPIAIGIATLWHLLIFASNLPADKAGAQRHKGFTKFMNNAG